MPSANYILTTFSLTMFGDKATSHIRKVEESEARKWIDDNTQVVATRMSHDNMAQNLFGKRRTVRYADLGPDKSAIGIIYRGPPVPDDGTLPKDGQISYYLIEVEEYYDDT